MGYCRTVFIKPGVPTHPGLVHGPDQADRPPLFTSPMLYPVHVVPSLPGLAVGHIPARGMDPRLAGKSTMHSACPGMHAACITYSNQSLICLALLLAM